MYCDTREPDLWIRHGTHTSISKIEDYFCIDNEARQLQYTRITIACIVEVKLLLRSCMDVLQNCLCQIISGEYPYYT